MLMQRKRISKRQEENKKTITLVLDLSYQLGHFLKLHLRDVKRLLGLYSLAVSSFKVMKIKFL